MKKILPPVLGALVALGAAPIALAQTAASPAKGQQVFKTQCGACHSVVAGKNQIGPSLAGVVGRKAGKAAGFKYSPALAKASFTWDKARLDKFVAGLPRPCRATACLTPASPMRARGRPCSPTLPA